MDGRLMEWGEFAAAAVSVPFADHGRTWDGVDCWGLVVLAYRHVLGVELPTYETGEYRDCQAFREMRRHVEAVKAESWREIVPPSRPRIGDVAVIFKRGLPVHVGICLGAGRVIHAEHGVGVVVQPESQMRVEGWFSHAA